MKNSQVAVLCLVILLAAMIVAGEQLAAGPRFARWSRAKRNVYRRATPLVRRLAPPKARKSSPSP